MELAILAAYEVINVINVTLAISIRAIPCKRARACISMRFRWIRRLGACNCSLWEPRAAAGLAQIMRLSSSNEMIFPRDGSSPL